MLIAVCLSLLLLIFLSASFCTCSYASTPVSFQTPVLCHAERSSFMMASPARTSRAISVGEAFCTYDIESHAVSKSLMAVMAREYLPTKHAREVSRISSDQTIGMCIKVCTRYAHYGGAAHRSTLRSASTNTE